jgi:hypothetical protein
MAKRKGIESKAALLQQHFKGELQKVDENELGDWSKENLAKNRLKMLEKEAPWVLKNMSISDYYDHYIKPTQKVQVT